MDQYSSDNDPVLYAKHFTGSISGSRYLIFRDIPELIKQYVKGTRALDYGCGPGESTRFLRSLGLKVEGMDISQHMIDLAKDKEPSEIYETIRSGEIPRQDNYYDVINATIVLVHVSTMEELEKIAQEIARVLKVGGTFITVVNSPDTFHNEWLSASTDFEENKKITSGSRAKYFCKIANFLYNEYFWSEEDLTQAFNKAGLKVVRIHKPRGTDSDGWNWVNEKDKDYVSIFIAQKQ